MKIQTGNPANDVVEMVQHIVPEDPAFADELEDQINRRKIVNQLARLRNLKGISQADVAAELNCTQSCISKLENGFDENLTLRELAAYADLAGSDLTLILEPRDATFASQIRYHAARIKACFKKINGMAEGDHAVSNGVADFHLDALVNLATVAGEAAQGVHPATTATGEPIVSLQLPLANLPENSAGPIHTGVAALS